MKEFTQRPGHAVDQVGLLLARRLDSAAVELPADIGERLRFARSRALARARQAQLQTAGTSALALGGFGAIQLAGAGGPGSALGSTGFGPGPGRSWATRLVALLPLLILALGLFAIQDKLTLRQIAAAVEIDAALLADDLPPQAYSDPGFAEFLRRQDR